MSEKGRDLTLHATPPWSARVLSLSWGMSRTAVALSIGLLATLACTGEPTDAREVIVRDSAGIRIVENPDVGPTRRWGGR